VITGFNTDVKHETKVFHVQTEDRGLANPVVESLVYVGGEILMSKRSPYRHLINGDHVDEKALRKMMDLQHHRVIEAVRRDQLDKGKIGDAPAPPARRAAPPPPARAPAPAAPPKPKSGAALRSLDQVIVDYLASEAASEHLEIALTADGELVSGETVALTVKASTSLTEKPLAGAHVSIRIVSTVRPPQILFRGVTGANGVVKSVCVLPDIGTGNAALIIAASSGLGNNEIKQLIRKKSR
jgi:hypothetical protein